MNAPVVVHAASGGNGYMNDIAGWLVEAARATGRAAELETERLPAPDGSLHLVVAPHEYFELADQPTAALQRAAAASVCVCTEQPGTPWFHLSVDAARRGLGALDINRQGVAALRALGIAADHLPLGAVPSMVSPLADREPDDRPLDVVFLGGHDPRRGAVLADLAPRWYRRHTELRLFRFDRPVTAATPGVVFGRDKYDLLASARILVNVHRDRSDLYPPGHEPPAYFEWARLLEAMANGCVVVSEPSHDHEPLVAGEHFVAAGIDELGDAIDRLLDDPGRLRSISHAARHAATTELALADTMSTVLERLERTVLPHVADHVRTSRPTTGLWRLGAAASPPPTRLGPFAPYAPVLATAKRLALAENRTLRRLDAAACLLHHGTEQHLVRVATPAFDAPRAEPKVSVVVTVYDYADVVTETLDSIVASTDVDIEVIVVEDHANDDSRRVIVDHLAAHPDVPMLLVGKEANQGLAAARNTGFEHARASYVMVMDADNHVYPTCLSRLAETLDEHRDAAAAYAILEQFGDERDLLSAQAWDVERLCRANYIDAQAMWRRSDWERLGGYRDDDDHVFGWEDLDLWLRLAASGGHAVLRPEILGRYRVRRGSMISLTNLETALATSALRRRYPTLPWPDDAAVDDHPAG